MQRFWWGFKQHQGDIFLIMFVMCLSTSSPILRRVLFLRFFTILFCVWMFAGMFDVICCGNPVLVFLHQKCFAFNQISLCLLLSSWNFEIKKNTEKYENKTFENFQCTLEVAFLRWQTPSLFLNKTQYSFNNVFFTIYNEVMQVCIFFLLLKQSFCGVFDVEIVQRRSHVRLECDSFQTMNNQWTSPCLWRLLRRRRQRWRWLKQS